MNRILLIFSLMVFSAAGFAGRPSCKVSMHQNSPSRYSHENKQYYVYRCECRSYIRYEISTKPGLNTMASLGKTGVDKCDYRTADEAEQAIVGKVSSSIGATGNVSEHTKYNSEVSKIREEEQKKASEAVALNDEYGNDAKEYVRNREIKDLEELDQYAQNVYGGTNSDYGKEREKYQKYDLAANNLSAEIKKREEENAAITGKLIDNDCGGANAETDLCKTLANDVKNKNEAIRRAKKDREERIKERDKSFSAMESQVKDADIAKTDLEIAENKKKIEGTTENEEDNEKIVQTEVGETIINNEQAVLTDVLSACKAEKIKTRAECTEDYKKSKGMMENLDDDQKAEVASLVADGASPEDAITQVHQNEVDRIQGEENKSNEVFEEEVADTKGSKALNDNVVCKDHEVNEDSSDMPPQPAGNPDACTEIFSTASSTKDFYTANSIKELFSSEIKKKFCDYIDNMEGCSDFKKKYRKCEDASEENTEIIRIVKAKQVSSFDQTISEIDHIEKFYEENAACKGAINSYISLATQQDRDADKLSLAEDTLRSSCGKRNCHKYYMEEYIGGTNVEGLNGCRRLQKKQFDKEVIRPCEAYLEIAKTVDDRDDAAQDVFQSMDGRFRCQKKGRYTADYKSCKKIVQFYNASFIGEQGMELAQQGAELGHQNKIQRMIASGDEDQAESDKADMEAAAENEVAYEGSQGVDKQKAAFAAVKQTNKFKGGQETARATFYGTKAAVLGGMLAAWATPKNIERKCENGALCNLAASYEGKKQYTFPNADVKAAFMMDMFQAVGKATMAGILANNYFKQAKIVKQFEDDYKKYQPKNDDPSFEINPCATNPNLTICQNGNGNRRTVAGYQQNKLNFSGGGTQEYGVLGEDESGVMDENDEYNKIKDPTVIADIDDLFDDSKKKKTGNENHAPSAAKLGDGSSAAAGGGGGGGGLGGGGGGGGGGSGAKKPGKNGPAQVNAKTGGRYAKSKYSGASGYGKGGGKGSRNKKKKNDNMFNSAFNKKSKSRGVASMDVGVAPKTSSLFKSISRRYSRVRADKRIQR